ncbi:MAG: hypothetical protein NT091_01475, partial [Candidatus Falkowbacteria bacterium]|nr:hypothetical protein [Candidatus Falkowbacteria bacterium]
TITQTSGSGTSNVLSWTHSKGVSTIVYSIYRSTSASVTATTSNLIGTSTSATYTDNTTSALTSYYYNVTAVDNSSDASALSTELRLCSTKTTTNGTIASDCAITCNTPDYILSGNSCVSASTNVVLSGASTLAVSGSTTLTATIKDASNNTMTTDNSSIVAFTISNANGTISTSSAQ